MTKIDRWLLPDGIEEILPDRAIKVERLRRRLLDLYHSWGYDLVIPPLAEFTESLLSGSGSDLDLMTFKITDQLTGRMMGVRADITPQAARMDAHSLQRNSPNRLCYAGQVLYTRARGPLESRSPIQLGIELFGEASLDADVEVMSLLVETLSFCGLEDICLDIGHVGIYRALEQAAGLSAEQSGELFALLQRKDAGLQQWLATNVADASLAAMLAALPGLAGDASMLAEAKVVLAKAPAEVLKALSEVEAVASQLAECAPQAALFLDLSELRGYHYHTGIVFAAYTSESTLALGNGGRYDDVGEAFGRARPATGFGIDLSKLANLVAYSHSVAAGIYAPAPPALASHSEWAGEIARLRENGERVVRGFSGQHVDYDELHCDRVLMASDCGFTVEPAAANAVGDESE
ncbi:MAG: ATP phosphoribosyltransferase regulatory subunit [Gammaproteobacteria bacterium]|nr:ATP phosphoribosyltransferase regulatory subunit [Gammaproteobacteria bacterium]MBQ0839388.1 ATP phosphoribosyltransferase regulatory subunit [Gammaproteobacteria bacterium]